MQIYDKYLYCAYYALKKNVICIKLRVFIYKFDKGYCRGSHGLDRRLIHMFLVHAKMNIGLIVHNSVYRNDVCSTIRLYFCYIIFLKKVDT